ncbi:hypothetical protein NC652_030718 [Populus alba x Populus x berolinensis]|nr:hypothetical protein NC652_030718 [Populus alba x Populus x berolinensis]
MKILHGQKGFPWNETNSSQSKHKMMLGRLIRRVDFWLGDDQRHMIIAGDSLWNAYLKDNPDAHP